MQWTIDFKGIEMHEWFYDFVMAVFFIIATCIIIDINILITVNIDILWLNDAYLIKTILSDLLDNIDSKNELNSKTVDQRCHQKWLFLPFGISRKSGTFAK